MKYSIIIPFRDRFEHLKVLIPHLRSFAKRKNLDVEIIISEQVDDNHLRRGALRNEGVRISTGDILVFHDVDYLPNDDVDYWTDSSDVFRAIQRVEFITMVGTPRPENETPSGYRTFKDGIDDNFFGGVLCMTRKAFNKTNGYNPLYQGWGLEDDDFRERIYRAGLKVESGKGTFLALPHPDSFKNDEAFRYNSMLFANKEKIALVGMSNTTVDVKLNQEKSEKYDVDKWIEVTNWEVVNPLDFELPYPQLSKLDYGYFTLLPNANTDHIHKAVVAGNRWEPEVLALCEKYIKPNTTVIDVGANMGTFTVRFSQLVGPKGTVIAFEPQRIIYQQLCANIFLNNLRNVQAHQLAISNMESYVTLTPINYDGGAPGEVRVDGDSGEQVPCISLDSLNIMNDISLLKIDVERYEPYVFDGAKSLIEKYRPVILFELTTLPLPEWPADYILHFLYQREYNVYKVSEWGDYIALPQEKDDNS